MKKIILYSFLIILSFGAIISIGRATQRFLTTGQQIYHDFSGRWTLTNIILMGENPYRMSLDNTVSAGAEKILADNPDARLDARQLPSSEILYLLFSGMSLDNAKISWLVINFIFTYFFFYLTFSIFGLQGQIGIYKYALLVLLTLCGTPFRAIISNGQSSVISFVFFLLAILCEKKRMSLLSGAFLFLSLVRYHLILPFILFFFILKKRWLPLVVCSILAFTSHLWLSSLMRASPIAVLSETLTLNGNLTGYVRVHTSFDVWGLFARIKGLIGLDKILDIITISCILTIIVLLYILYKNNRHNEDDMAWMSILSIFSLFYVYHGNYDAICLFFPLVWVFTIKEFNLQRILVILGICYFFFLQRVIWYLMWTSFGSIKNFCWIIDAIFFYMIFYNVARIMKPKNCFTDGLRPGYRNSI